MYSAHCDLSSDTLLCNDVYVHVLPVNLVLKKLNWHELFCEQSSLMFHNHHYEKGYTFQTERLFRIC